MKTPSETPPNAEFGRLRSFLATRGFSQQWITSAIGYTPNGRTRLEITNQLKEALKVLPKGGV